MNSGNKFCDNCGATNRSDARFCYACGQPQMTYAQTATGLLDSSYTLKQRYRIVEKLGQGGFGAIYKVEDMLFNDATRAVKEMGMRGLSPQETQEAIVAFRNEALLLANLAHPNLPRIYDHFEEHGRWYLVMDYIHGETLEKRLAGAPGGKLTVTQVIEIGLQLCTVLSYLHNHQPPIIFRDLKPDNVMITADSQLYLVDFGIARFFKPGQARDTVSLGTPGYAAPEQYGRGQTTIRSDIYSLGATLYHLVSGIHPGLHPFLVQALELDTLIPGNAALETLIMGMLELKEDRRPQDTGVVKQELLRIQQVRRIAFTTVKQAPLPVKEATPPLKEAATPMTAPLAVETRPSILVAQQGGGQYTTISEALQNAAPGSFILVQKGIYKESLLLDRAVEIIGNGPRDGIVLECGTHHCVTMRTEHATIRGITIRLQTEQGGQGYHALAIPQGQLLVEDCAISSNAAASIAIYNATTNPTFRYCTIHGSTSQGIVVYEHAQGVIEYCDIFHHGQDAVRIATGGNPTFHHCTIHDNQRYGLFADDSAQGTFEDCEFYQNTFSGTIVTTQSNPLLLRCKLHHNQRHGVEVHESGRGSFQDCDIYANAHDNVLIATESTPYFYLCRIYDGAQSGVTVRDSGKGTIQYCAISANSAANISIAQSGDPLIQNCKIRQGQRSGIHVYDGGRGTIEYCTISENADKALDITPGCDVKLKRNQ